MIDSPLRDITAGRPDDLSLFSELSPGLSGQGDADLRFSLPQVYLSDLQYICHYFLFLSDFYSTAPSSFLTIESTISHTVSFA